MSSAAPSHRPPFPTSALDFHLPGDLIAQHPPARRDDSRLLVADARDRALSDRTIRDLPGLLSPGDVLVLNDTRVLPARVLLRRETGALIEGLFVADLGDGRWDMMLKNARKLKAGERLAVRTTDDSADEDAQRRPSAAHSIRLLERTPQGRWIAEPEPAEPAEQWLSAVGLPPLPPYIKRTPGTRAGAETNEDRERYQTIFAERSGAIAAPTAGLHFTPELLAEIQDRGVRLARITLHVGIGTFQPVTADDLSDHTMHAERFEVGQEAADEIARAKSEGARVVAVGTTCVRTLESVAARVTTRNRPPVAPMRGESDLFIYPPYQPKLVDALLTNFHLPQSTLLALVMALAGEELIREAYAHAVRERYRFFSYGDAMFLPVLPGTPG